MVLSFSSSLSFFPPLVTNPPLIPSFLSRFIPPSPTSHEFFHTTDIPVYFTHHCITFIIFCFLLSIAVHGRLVRASLKSVKREGGREGGIREDNRRERDLHVGICWTRQPLPPSLLPSLPPSLPAAARTGRYCLHMKRKRENTPKMRNRKKAKVAMAPSALLSLADSAWRLQGGGGEERDVTWEEDGKN